MKWIGLAQIDKKEALIRASLTHHEIKAIQGKDLMLTCKHANKFYAAKITQYRMEKELIVFWLLFSSECSPPFCDHSLSEQKP
ncbi:MAG: hypothetical protein ABI045_01065 [Flavobacteriales bacterium]